MDTAPHAAPALAPLGDDARRLCQALLRMDTTNPPGNERICADYLAAELAEVGYAPTLLEGAPRRTNLVVRHRGARPAQVVRLVHRRGRGAHPPLLLTAPLDVVGVEAARWRRPPFSGD